MPMIRDEFEAQMDEIWRHCTSKQLHPVEIQRIQDTISAVCRPGSYPDLITGPDGVTLFRMCWEDEECSVDLRAYPDWYRVGMKDQIDRYHGRSSKWLGADDELTTSIAFIYDCRVARSLGLTLAEWRAMTGQAEPE